MLRSRLIGLVTALALALGLVVAWSPAPPAAALSPDLPFSADALPTWQTNGVVWEMAESHGRVVVGGSFTQLRPGAGASGTVRNVAGLAILDADTGQPDPCQLPASFSGGNAAVYAVDAAPDGNTVFVGGQFTNLGGVSVTRLAEIDVVNCRVTSFRVASISSYVLSIDVADDAVYFGGVFQSVAGQQRRSFAKVSRAGALQPWVANVYGATEELYSQVVVPDKNARGDALELSPEGDRLAIGGDFFYLNGTATHSFAVVDATSGDVLRTWPANTVGNTSRTKQISSDGTRFFVAQEGFGGYDGNIAFNWSDYSQAWRDNCAGATQAVYPYDGLLFKAHHHHDCGSMGMFPDGRRTFLSATHADDPTQWQIGWLPELNDGTGEGIGGRSLVVSTGSDGTDYLWVGGEFTRVNGVAQQGLTRFSASDTGAPPTPVATARSITPNAIQVSFRSVYDRDDSDSTYAVYRNNSTTPIWTGVARSQHWYRHQVTFVDTTVNPGTTYSYRVRAIDAAGNQSGLSAAVSATASASGSAYASAVIDDGPRLYYRYDDVTSDWVVDSAGQTVEGLNGLAQNGVNRTAAGAIAGDPSRSATFTEGLASGLSQYIWNDVIAYGPTQFSIETWFRTSSTTGGALVNYGSYQGRPRSDTGEDRVSSTVDRVVYMENSTGRLRFGVRSGPVQTLRTDQAYNDGQWHHVVATQGSAGMRLYVDGVLVGQNSVTGNQSYRGTWHVGGDNLSGYPNSGNQANQRYFDGQIDETAVYYRPLAQDEAVQHYTLAAPDTTAPTVPGTPSASVDGADVDLAWSASTDAAGVTGYAVYRGTTSDFVANTGSRIAQPTGTSYTDANRPAGTWFYKVTAVDAAGNVSGASDAAAATVEADDDAPSTPGTPTASVSVADVSLSWTASTDNVGVTGYAVYRGTTSDFVANTGSRIAQPTGTSYVDADRPAGTWYYKVTAVDAEGNVSEVSAAASAIVEESPLEPIVETVVASADTMVAAVNPAFVYGTSNQLSARGNSAIWSFLQFQVPDAPAGYALTGATLRLVTSNDATAGSADAHQVQVVDQAWSEASTTWNNRPTQVDSGVLGQLTGATALNTAYTATLSSGELASRVGEAVTLRLSTVNANSTDNVRLWSREAGNAALRPTLTLTYTGAGAPDTTAPSVPSGLAAAVDGADVDLSWSASTDAAGVTGYAVYRGTTADFVANTASRIAQPTGTSYTDANRPAGTWYYKVTAVDAAGNVSGASTSTSATVEEPDEPDTTAPSVPVGLAASVDGADVALSWSASTDDVGVTGYAVYRGTTSDFVANTGSRIAQPTGTSYIDANRPAGTWYYKVTAVDAEGNVSEVSAAASAIVEESPLEPIVETVVASADTMVAAVNPAFVYGTSNQLSARGNSAIWSFLQFQVPDAPAGYALTGATLRLVTSNDATAGSADAHQVQVVDQAWSEASTTWNNRPTQVDSGVLGQLTGATALNTAYTATLSSGELASRVGEAVTLRLSTVNANSTDNVRLWSREAGDAALRPTLTLTYTPLDG